MQRFGLYYPYVHFSSDAWAKASALYWPRMGRIIPPHFVAHDSDAIRELRDGLDFIIDIDPAPAVERVSGAVLEVLDRHQEELERRYPASVYRPWLDDGDGLPSDSLLAWPLSSQRKMAVWAGRRTVSYHPVNDEYLAEGRPPTAQAEPQLTELPREGPPMGTWEIGLHGHEVTTELRRRLAASDLAYGTGDIPWIAVSSPIAWVHLCALASDLAARNNLVPVTDEPIDPAAGGTWDANRIATALLGPARSDQPRDVFTVLGLLALRLVVPADLHHVPASVIVEIRQRYGAEFDAFNASLRDLADQLYQELQETGDSPVLAAYLDNEVRIRFRQPLRELEAAMRGLKVETAFAAANIKFELPAIVAATAGGLLTGNPFVAAAGAAAFAAIGLGHTVHRERTAALRPSAESYLFRIDRAITPGRLIDHIRWSPPRQTRRHAPRRRGWPGFRAGRSV